MEDDTMNRKAICKAGILLSAILCCACSQNDVMDYSLDGKVYFYETTVVNNATKIVTERNYSFALQNSALMQDTLRIPVQLMGDVADYDRVFRAEAVADSTTAESPKHYTILDGAIKAGEYKAFLPVVVNRTDDTKEHYVSVLLRLVPTGDLTTGNADALTYRISFGDMLMKPTDWPYTFGVYSVNKYRFAIDVLGLTNWPQASRHQDSDVDGYYSLAQLQHMASQLNKAYTEYRTTHGPIYVDDEASEKEEIYYASDK